MVTNPKAHVALGDRFDEEYDIWGVTIQSWSEKWYHLHFDSAALVSGSMIAYPQTGCGHGHFDTPSLTP